MSRRALFAIAIIAAADCLIIGAAIFFGVI